MANSISDETLEYVGILAKLELSEEEKAGAKKDMEQMLSYIDQLKELDTAQAEPLSHAFATENVFREDVVANTDGHEATLLNAPEKKGRCFTVPNTFR
ncbi:MAG: Asp-tRNA(Asn)/Glu-tRNA(Gln) amidotransferase subunit GatC [Eubacterium sp.]|nr:Asp-tRNA(Asn)/Glu-tRNA(Gln) amidotransferase subunit GatC [Eubacterium sp.]